MPGPSPAGDARTSLPGRVVRTVRRPGLPGCFTEAGARLLRWEDVPACPVCGSTRRRPFDHYVVDMDHHFMRCLNCDLLYLSPRPVREFVEKVYDGALQYSHTEKESRAQHEGTQRRYEETLDLIEQAKPAGGTLLDVGCSTGGFMLTAMARGWRAAGVELSAGAVATCREKGLDVRRADIASEAPGGERYDAVTLLHVLEHTPDPALFLAAARDRTRDDGVIVVDVPNIMGLNRYCARFWARIGLARYRICSPKHLLEFTWNAFGYLARSLGLRIASAVTYSNRFSGPGLVNDAYRAVLKRFLVGNKFRFLLTKKVAPPR